MYNLSSPLITRSRELVRKDRLDCMLFSQTRAKMPISMQIDKLPNGAMPWTFCNSFKNSFDTDSGAGENVTRLWMSLLASVL
jgi:hypothetical protein